MTMLNITILRKTMHELGFAESLRGTRLLVQAAQMHAENPDRMLTKEVYPAIGRAAGLTAGQVERNIRSAISDAVSCCGDHETSLAWRRFMGGQNPTNGEVIARLAGFVDAD